MTEKYATKIPNWPVEERPRERLAQHGPASLTDAELLAIMLRTGTGTDTAIDLARHILKTVQGFRGLDALTVADLCKIKGIGTAKAAQIKAALEIGKRLMKQQIYQQAKLTSSNDVYQYMAPQIRDLNREVFNCIYLTGRNTIIKDEKLFEGTLNESVVSAREIIRKAIDLGAASVVLVHNHPSGDPEPSKEDNLSTEKIKKACELFNIKILDHVIVGKSSYFSFADEGLL